MLPFQEKIFSGREKTIAKTRNNKQGDQIICTLVWQKSAKKRHKKRHQFLLNIGNSGERNCSEKQVETRATGVQFEEK